MHWESEQAIKLLRIQYLQHNSLCICVSFAGYDGDSTFTQYIFHTEKLKWNEAKQVCENNGGTLAKVETLTRYTAIKDVAKSLYDLNILYVKLNLSFVRPFVLLHCLLILTCFLVPEATATFDINIGRHIAVI